MAITRLLQTGFEWSTVEFLALFPNIIATAPSVYSIGAFTDSYLGEWEANEEGVYTNPLGSAIAQCRIGFHLHAQTTGSGDNILIAGLGKTDHTTEIISLYYDEDAAGLELFAGATSLGTYAYDMSYPGRWTHFGIDVKIDGAAGWAYVYIEGEQVIGFSGDTNDGGADFDVLVIGPNAAGQNWTAKMRMDDLYWDDTTGEGAAAVVPKKRFYWIQPNGNGNYADWDGSDGNQVNNYQLIDDFHGLSTTDYVESQVAAEFDSYALAAAPSDDINTITAVIPFVYAIDDGAGGPDSISIGTRLGGTDLMGADIALPTSYGIVFERQTTKPGGGAWTTTDIDSTELVIESA